MNAVPAAVLSTVPGEQQKALRIQALRIDVVFLVLIAIHLLPVWWFAFFPSQDGPAHIANAYLLKNFHVLPRAADFFSLHLSAFPNWFSHAFLAGAMYLVAPLTAEKLLLSVYVLTFAGGIRYLAVAIHGRRAAPVYFLWFLFVYNYSLHLGFYNFGLGVGLYCFALGFWWRYRDAMSLRRFTVLNALFVAMYFVHLLPLLMALGSVLSLGLLTIRGQLLRRCYLLLGLAPAWLLPLWYLASQPVSSPRFMEHGNLVGFLVSLGPMVSFDAQQALARTLAIVLVALICYAVVERANLFMTDPARRRGSFVAQPSDAFYLLAVIVSGVYLLAPVSAADGAHILSRLALFPVLVLVVALTVGRSRWINWSLCTLGAALIAGQLYLLAGYYARLNADLAELTSAIERMPANKTLMPLFFNSRGSVAGNRVRTLLHASNYYVAQAQAISLENYEAETEHFPVRFRANLVAGTDRPFGDFLQYFPALVEPGRFTGIAETVLTWELDPGSPTATQIARDYRQTFVSSGGRLRLFERRLP